MFQVMGLHSLWGILRGENSNRFNDSPSAYPCSRHQLIFRFLYFFGELPSTIAPVGAGWVRSHPQRFEDHIAVWLSLSWFIFSVSSINYSFG